MSAAESRPVLNQSLYIFASKIAGYAVRLILPYFLVRLLSVSDFGAYRQFFLLDMYIGALLQLGLTQALYYFIPRDVRNAGAYLLNSVLMNLLRLGIGFTVIGLASGPISQWLNMAILKDAFWMLTLYSVTMILAVSCDTYLIARQKVKASAAFEVLGQTLASVVCVAVAFLTRRLDAILIGLVAARIVQLVAMSAYIHWRLHGFKSERYFFGIREQIRYGMVLGASGPMFTMLMRLHEFFVSRYYGTEAYGIYSAGCTELPIIQLFVQSLAAVALVQFAKLEQDNDWEGIRALWRKVLTSSYAVALPVIAVLLLVSKPLILFMFTETSAEALPIFQVNTLAKIGLVFNSALVLRAMNRNDISIWTNAITLVLAPLLLYVGMKLGGMVGIIAAQALLMIGCRLLGNVILNRIIPAPLPYVVRPGELLDFYRDTWLKARERISSRRRARHGGL
ncbi:MAG: oligosaccharide flippase family protein [Ahniella sp.]|nr:oligosaccharide flippase family protein [Ahniella sp.]